MLVLTRLRHERIIIDVPPSATTQRIAVSLVCSSKGFSPKLGAVTDKARIGIDAEPSVKVMREELVAAATQQEESSYAR